MWGKKLMVCGLSAVVLFLSQPGLALSQSQKPAVKFDRNTGEITLSGYTEVSNEVVGLEILYPGVTPEDLERLDAGDDIDGAKGMIRYFWQGNSDDKGYWGHSFKWNAPSETYPVHIFTDSNQVYIIELKYTDPAQLRKIVADINAEPDARKAEELITDHIEMLGLDNEVYQDLVKHNIAITSACQRILSRRPIQNLDSFLKVAAEEWLILAFNQIKDSAILDGYIKNDPQTLVINEKSVYRDYGSESESVRYKVIARMKNNGYKTVADIGNDFVNVALPYFVTNISQWNSLGDLAETYQKENQDRFAVLAGLKTNEYKNLSGERRKGAAGDIMKLKDTALGLDGFVSKFNEITDEWKNKNLNASSGSGNDPGNGGSKPDKSTGVGHVSVTMDENMKPNPENRKEPVFDDLGSVPWAEESILRLYEKGIVSGRGDRLFEVHADITREEFVKMLVSAVELEIAEDAVCTFKDVEEGAWYYKYVACAQKTGITAGDEGGNFGTSRSITREEMAAMIERTINLCGIDAKPVKEKIEFTDREEISTYAYDSVERLQKADVINGMENGSFAPKAHATRAQAAVMIYKVLNLQKTDRKDESK